MSATSFCSGRRSITGYGVSGSNSVEFAPSMSTTWRANSATAICMPRQMPRNGIFCSRAIRDGGDLALDPAHAEAAGDQDAVGAARRASRTSLVVERLGVDPVDLDRAAVLEAGVAQRLGDGQVGVLELDVLADERDPHRVVARRPRVARRISRSQSAEVGRRASSIPKCSSTKSSTPSAWK